MSADPFTLSPEPHLLYLTDSLHETLDKVRFTLDRRQGLTIVYGDVGHGKSSLARLLFDEYSARDDVAVAYLPSPDYRSPLAFLKAICGEFGLKRKQSKLDQEQELKQFLGALYAEQKNCIALVDEAQTLKGHVLELVRSLLNFETNSAKLINFCLCGQLELRDTLRDKSKKALRSRIFLVSTLNPFTLSDTEAMIRHRCQATGVPIEFDPDAVEAVFRHSKGVPREVNKYCSVAWLFALRNGRHVVTADLVEAATAHVEEV